MSEMVERVATSIRREFRRECQIARLSPMVSRALARAAIAAMREPTVRMVAAGGSELPEEDDEHGDLRPCYPGEEGWRAIWRAMIDEALR